MVAFSAFRRSLVALAFCSAAVAASSPASARSHHGSQRSAHARYPGHHFAKNTGHKGTGSDFAASFARYGQRVSGPQVGAIAVMGRRGGGHVGIITGIDARGNPIMISGNNGNRVREAPVSRGRIYAYVMPN